MVEGSQGASIAGGITGTTSIVSFIIPQVPNITIWRVFMNYNNQLYELTYFDIISGAWLYSYTQGDVLTIACDESGLSFTATFFYRIYLDDSQS